MKGRGLRSAVLAFNCCCKRLAATLPCHNTQIPTAKQCAQNEANKFCKTFATGSETLMGRIWSTYVCTYVSATHIHICIYVCTYVCLYIVQLYVCDVTIDNSHCYSQQEHNCLTLLFLMSCGQSTSLSYSCRSTGYKSPPSIPRYPRLKGNFRLGFDFFLFCCFCFYFSADIVEQHSFSLSSR